MERLTDWLDEETKTEVSIVHYKMRDAMIRLAQYEEIGLTPEQLLEVDRLYAEKCQEVAELRKQQPTAYDVDKVIEQIGKKMFSAELHDNGWDGQTINELLCMGDVYEIAKAGGVDE